MATIPNQTQHQTANNAAPYASRTAGLAFDRFFTRPGISPYDEIVWELRDAVIQDFKGPSSSSRRTSRSPPTGR